MVSIPVILALIGIFLAIGGLGLTRTAFDEGKGLVEDIKFNLKKTENANEEKTSTQSPEDRAVEDK